MIYYKIIFKTCSFKYHFPPEMAIFFYLKYLIDFFKFTIFFVIHLIFAISCHFCITFFRNSVMIGGLAELLKKAVMLALSLVLQNWKTWNFSCQVLVREPSFMGKLLINSFIFAFVLNNITFTSEHASLSRYGQIILSFI